MNDESQKECFFLSMKHRIIKTAKRRETITVTMEIK